MEFHSNIDDFSVRPIDCNRGSREKSGVPAIVQREYGIEALAQLAASSMTHARLFLQKKRRSRSGEHAININRAADRAYESTQLTPSSSTIWLRLPTNQDQAFRQPIHGKLRSFFEIFQRPIFQKGEF